MATLVSPQIRWTADQYVNHCGYRSAVLSGIAPDSRHLDNGGFHCSVEDLRRFGNADDYSNTRPDDRNFNIQYGAAIDVSMSPADMRKHHARIHAVWADHTDPRRKYFNAVNTWDGSGDAVRLDFVTNTAKPATADHKWHAHDETRRRYLLDPVAARAKVSVWKGETKAQWLASQSPEEDTMTKDEFLELLRDTDVRKALATAVLATDGVIGAPAGSKNQDGTPNTHWAATSYFANTFATTVSARDHAAKAATGVAALAGKDFVNEQVLAEALTAAVVEALPADRDDVSPAELQQALLGALRELVDPVPATPPQP